jgi:hypothetical protein
MTKIYIPANALGDLEGKGKFIDPSAPCDKPVQMYRVKGSKQVISQLPPRANLYDYEPYTPEAAKVIRYPLHRIRDTIRQSIVDGELPPDTDVEVLAQHLFEIKNTVEPIP